MAAVHPEDYSVDLVMQDDGSRLAGVQVLSMSASSNAGSNDMPQPSGGSDPWSLSESKEGDVLAAVLFFGRQPVVMGFRFPQVSQVLFAELGRRVNRHSSDVYTTTDAQGNTEFYHPSGTFFRIGTTAAHEDLSGKNADGNWAITKNTGAAVHLQLTVGNGGAEMASLNIDPSGALTLKLKGTALIDVVGDTTLKSPNVTLDTPSTTCTGKLTVMGGMDVSGGSAGSTAVIRGPVQIEGATLTHNGKDVGSTHSHGGVQTGSGSTNVPN